MTQALTAETGDAGVLGAGLLVNTRLGWIYRLQPFRDVGIDAQIEVVLSRRESGRLLGVQVKSGPHCFAEPTPDGTGWIYRWATQRHRDYWLRYDLNVIVVLYDIDAHVAYWQHITEDTAEPTGIGFKVVVPASQRLDASAKPALAALAHSGPVDGLPNLLEGLPGPCAARLQLLDEEDPVTARGLAAAMVAGRTAQPDGQPGRWLAFAGFVLAVEDPSQSRALLIRAADLAGRQLLAAIGLAGLDHGAASGPVPIPKVIVDGGERVEADATVQRFLADQATRAGDRTAAILHHEQALRLAPDSVSQQLTLAEALLRGDSAPMTATRMVDYRRAANLASAARAATLCMPKITSVQVRWHAMGTGVWRARSQVTPPTDGAGCYSRA